jgi:DNA-binding transcriptional ArsR family regulator
MNEQLFQELELLHDRLCRAIGDPRRLMIIYALKDAPRYVVELADELEIPQPTVSRHLNELYKGGIVGKERRGQAVYYFLRDERILQALDLMRAMLRDRMGEMARLTALPEETE